MPSWGEAFGAIGDNVGGSIWTVSFIFAGGFFGLILLGIVVWWWFVKKKWNLKVEIKLPRSDGKLTNAEWGKGYFNTKRGVCFVKRPGMFQSQTPMKIFDIRKYIQGDNILTVIQASPDDMIPVLNNSWEEYEDEDASIDNDGNILKDKDGETIHEKASVMSIRLDPGQSKAWKAAWLQAAKQAYSLKSFFSQFQTPIAIGIVIIAVFVGFAIMWTRLGSVCG